MLVGGMIGLAELAYKNPGETLLGERIPAVIGRSPAAISESRRRPGCLLYAFRWR
jgi:hypothetical protein